MKKNPQEYALFLLQLRDRSIGEIKEKMKKRFSPEVTEKVITKLIEVDLLNNERFVQNYLRRQNIIRPIGKYLLKQKLRKLFIEEELIDKYLNNILVDEEIKEATKTAKKWLERKKIPKEKKYEKIGRFLVSRGYSYEVVKKVLDAIL